MAEANNYELIIIDCSGSVKRTKLPFQQNCSLTIGRTEDNDITIPDSIVSSHHGRIDIVNGRFFYSDTDSTNGSNVYFMSRNLLLHNTSQRIEMSEGTAIRVGSVKNRDKMVLIMFTCMGAGTVLKKCDIPMTGLTIGRGAGNGIVLNHPGVSRVHASLSYRGGRCVISDKRSRNGIIVNGKSVVSETELSDKDIIQILGFQLIYSGNCIYYKDRTGGISIHSDGIDKWVGKSDSRKQILTGADVDIKGNEFVAIIGGSGAGKSTLMNVINGFDKDYIGEVYYNNVSLRDNFQQLKNIIGYVPQEDIIYENLTLRKMLEYTGRLRMPEDMSDRERSLRIDRVLEMLDLTVHQNTFIRKMSGGQKKRASIAVELLADPKLLFLDEPTSGLDPGTEKNLMIAMRNLSRSQEQTIVMVTHTTQSLHLCDKIIFMGPGGRVCFTGTVDEAKRFFNTDDLTEIYNMIAENPEGWEAKRRSENPAPAADAGAGHNAALNYKPKLSLMRQFSTITSRYAELTLNNSSSSLLMLFEPIIIGALLCIVSAKGELFDVFEGTQSMMFAFSCAAIWIGIFNSIQEICKERSILKREYMANLKLPVYMTSKVFVQMIIGLVQAILLTLVFIAISDMIGKIPEGVSLEGLILGGKLGFCIEIIITAWFTIIASMALGLVVSAIAKSGDKAMVAAPFLLIIQLLFSGILFRLKGAVKVISYFTASRWSVEALGRITDLSHLEMRRKGLDGNPIIAADSGDKLIKEMFDNLQDKLISDWLILLIMAVAFLVISTILLRNVARDGR